MPLQRRISKETAERLALQDIRVHFPDMESNEVIMAILHENLWIVVISFRTRDGREKVWLHGIAAESGELRGHIDGSDS